jgi:conjugative transposon TraN protein
MQLFRTLLFFLSLCCVAFFTNAQNPLSSYPLSVTERKTSNIIFPFAIKSIDRGSRDILARKASGVDNVLQVKAALANFPPTNLSVITSDGKLYSFLVSYSAAPAMLTISFASDSLVRFENDSLNDALLDATAKQVLAQKKFLYRNSASEKMEFVLDRIYLARGLMWFSFEVADHSHVDYNPDYIHFFIADKRKAKRTAMQETEVAPLFRLPIGVIKGNSKATWVFGFTPFTLARGKLFRCKVSEQNGGRPLELKIHPRLLLRARAFSN